MATRMLDPLDAAMMAAESLSNPLHVAPVLIMSPPEDAGPGYIDQLYREMLPASDSLDPRLPRYPHRDLSTGGVWVWDQAYNIDVSEHRRLEALPVGSGLNALWQLISKLHGQPLDRSRPMWMCHLITGLDDGRFALYVKVRHTVMHGVAGMQLIAAGLTADPRLRSMPPIFAIHRDRPLEGSRHSDFKPPNPFRAVRGLVAAAASGATTVERIVSGCTRWGTDLDDRRTAVLDPSIDDGGKASGGRTRAGSVYVVAGA